jgi:thioredoxin 1
VLLSIKKVRSRHILIIALLLFEWLILAEKAPALEKDKAAAEVMKSLPRLVDVGADRCPPCIQMAPILEELRLEYSESLEVIFVDVWKNPTKAITYRVRMIPTLIFFDTFGNEVYRHSGQYSKDNILKKFEELKIPLKKIRKSR